MRYLVLITMLALASCTDDIKSSEDIEHFYAPAAGTIVVADSMTVPDELNDFYFSVYITTTDLSEEGRYLLQASHGHNEAKSEIVYPKLTQPLKPAIRKDETSEFSYIIGFTYDDGTFNDYAKIFANRVPGVATRIELRYLKAYYIDTVSKK